MPFLETAGGVASTPAPATPGSAAVRALRGEVLRREQRQGVWRHARHWLGLTLVLAGLGAANAATTWLVVVVHPLAQEWNPLAAAAIARFGFVGLLAFKGGVTIYLTLLLGLIARLLRGRPRLGSLVLALICVAVAVPSLLEGWEYLHLVYHVG